MQARSEVTPNGPLHQLHHFTSHSHARAGLAAHGLEEPKRDSETRAYHAEAQAASYARAAGKPGGQCITSTESGAHPDL